MTVTNKSCVWIYSTFILKYSVSVFIGARFGGSWPSHTSHPSVDARLQLDVEGGKLQQYQLQQRVPKCSTLKPVTGKEVHDRDDRKS